MLFRSASPANSTALRDFGLSFACAMALGLALGVAPADWFALRLDAISIVYVAAAILCGVAFTGLSLLKLRTLPLRLVAALIAGAIAGAILLWLDPALLKGPYAALDPWLIANWMSRIAEAETWLQSFADDPVYPVGVTVPVLVALAFALWNIARHKTERGAWAIVAAFLVVGLLVMLVQIRAARIVTPLAVPATAALVATVWRRLVARPGIMPALAAVGCMVISAGLAVAVLVALLPLPPPAPGNVHGDRQLCLQPAAFTALAAEPPQRLMAPIDLGAHLLLFTPHSVVGAPYHRNQQGLLDTFRFFNGPIADARAILEARGITRVVTCDNLTEVHGLPDHAPDSFVALYAAKTLPSWLVEQTPPGSALRIFAVEPR